MSEQEQISQLSALFDGELPSEQAGMVIRRALRDPALRATWGRYALIGACLRKDPLAGVLPQSDVAERVRARLATEAEHSAVPTTREGASANSRSSLLGRGAVGGAIAAGVALVSLLVVRTIGTVSPSADAPVQVAQAAPADLAQAPLVARVDAGQPSVMVTAVRDSQPPSYTTPVDNSPTLRGMPLMNYVALHSEVAASAVRFSPMSSTMSGGYDLTQGAVEMTAAEVGARH